MATSLLNFPFSAVGEATVAGLEYPSRSCDTPDCWLVGGMIYRLWVLGLVMVMMDGTREA